MSYAAPTEVDGSHAIEPSVDFEPVVISCDRYEQVVKLVGSNFFKFEISDIILF